MEDLLQPYDDVFFMKKALEQAQCALAMGEIPVGAVLVLGQKIIAKSHNMTERLVDVTAHAEMLSISSGASFLGGKYLINCTLYVTLEPCVMCAGALFYSQIGRVVVGAKDPNRGFLSKNLNLHPKTRYQSGILEKECSQILKDFFSAKR